MNRQEFAHAERQYARRCLGQVAVFRGLALLGGGSAIAGVAYFIEKPSVLTTFGVVCASGAAVLSELEARGSAEEAEDAFAFADAHE